MISGTSVLTDWVELPSQLYEHWLERPEILRRFAVHCDTGEPMPEDLLRRLLAARTFNQGFATVEYVASALVDLDIHLQRRTRRSASTSTPSSRPRSRASACRPRSSCATGPPTSSTCSPAAAMPRPITATCGRRCSTPTPSPRSRRPATSSMPATAKSLHDHVYAAGGTRDPAELYTAFRGRLPTPDGLLKRRGLSEEVRVGESRLHSEARCLSPRRVVRVQISRCDSNCGSLQPSPQTAEWSRPSTLHPWTSTPPDIAGASFARRITPPPRPGARSWPKAAMRSRPWWRWRRPSPPSIRT